MWNFSASLYYTSSTDNVFQLYVDAICLTGSAGLQSHAMPLYTCSSGFYPHDVQYCTSGFHAIPVKSTFSLLFKLHSLTVCVSSCVGCGDGGVTLISVAFCCLFPGLESQQIIYHQHQIPNFDPNPNRHHWAGR